MATRLTAAIVDGARATGKVLEIRDHMVTELFLRVLPSGRKNWCVKYTDPETMQSRRLYTLKNVPGTGKGLPQAREEARRFLGELLKSQKSPKTLKQERKIKAEQERANALKVGDLIEAYEKHLSHLKDPESRITDLRLIAKSCLGTKPIAALTAQDIQKYIVQEQKAGRKNRTINKKLTELYGMVGVLRRTETIPESVKLPPKPRKLPETDSEKNRRYFEPWERAALMQKSKDLQQYPWLQAAVIVSLQTGIRPNSLFHLRWSDIYWSTKTLRLAAEYMKTKDEWKIPINQLALDALKDWQAQWQGIYNLEPVDQFVFFKNSAREIIGEDDWRRAFSALCKLCQISNCTWYNMRHDFASQLVMLGVSLVTVRDLMCHTNIQTTQVYAHLAPDLKSAAVQQLAKL